MITWNMLKNHDEYIHLFKREPIVQKRYEMYKNTINVSDYILNQIIQESPFQLSLNQFPYHLEKDIHHYVLWIHPQVDISNKSVQVILENLKNELGFDELVYFENNYQDRSIKDIKHYQVFFK